MMHINAEYRYDPEGEHNKYYLVLSLCEVSSGYDWNLNFWAMYERPSHQFAWLFLP